MLRKLHPQNRLVVNISKKWPKITTEALNSVFDVSPRHPFIGTKRTIWKFKNIVFYRKCGNIVLIQKIFLDFAFLNKSIIILFPSKQSDSNSFLFRIS